MKTTLFGGRRPRAAAGAAAGAAAALALAAAVAAAALAGAAVPAVAADPIRIGSVVSATGPAAFLGDPEAKTLKLTVDEINAKGGLLGRPLELVLYDDGGDANKARTFATRLVEDDGVVAMVGGTTTGTTMAMIPVFEDAEIPFISLAGAIEIVEPTRAFVFKTPHTDKTACQKIFADMKARGVTKIALISGTDGFGKSMRNQCLKVIGDYGITVLADESYGPSDADMTPQLNKIKNTAGVEAVLNPGFGQGPAIVTRNYAQLGIALPLYQSHGVASKSFVELAGPAAEGVRLPAPALLIADKLADTDRQKPVVGAYKKAYEAATGEPVSTFGGYAFDGIGLLAAAITAANSAEPQAIRDALEATDGYVGATGIYTMSADDHLGLGTESFHLIEIRDGDWVAEPAP
jgi:branched-chain amino acid transport system substrate-binding protein